MSERFIFHKVFAEAIEQFSDIAAQSRLYSAICRYALCDEVPEIRNWTDAERIFVMLATAIIDRDKAEGEFVCETHSS